VAGRARAYGGSSRMVVIRVAVGLGQGSETSRNSDLVRSSCVNGASSCSVCSKTIN
jgi:hypothetical protein